MMDIVEEARKYAIAEIEKYGLPSIENFEISEKKAIELASTRDVDPKIVKLGVYLMDLKLGQAYNENRLPDHVNMSVAAATEFLDKFGIDASSKEKIINCIEAHHKSVPFTCMEAEICANADCYRFIHPKGVFGYFAFWATKRKKFPELLDMAEAKLDEKHAILSLPECKEELEPYYQQFKQLFKEAREL